MAIKLADIGLVGLAVMGKNLVLNMIDHGFTVCVFNRTTSKVDELLAEYPNNTNLLGSYSLKEMVDKLQKPRRVMLLVKAGTVVDQFIDNLLPHLEPGDIIIDGGNSEFTDTNRRCKLLDENGLLFVGTGVSGGEEGARHGPSLMPGGNSSAWPHIKPIFQAICARTTDTNEPCCEWVGSHGSGHYVKMVHNGIEYGDMQLISETYQMLRDMLKLSNARIASIFREWNQDKLSSYLIEITAQILDYKEPGGNYLIDNIYDVAGQKGTGKWTSINGLQQGSPITLITESVFARIISSLKDERYKASKVFPNSEFTNLHLNEIKSDDLNQFIHDISMALYASKIISYTQGFMLLQQAKKDFGWEIDLGNVALMWRAGCIIRSRFLAEIKLAFEREPNLQILMLDKEFFAEELRKCEPSWRRVVAKATLCGIPVPAFSSALAFFDGIRTENLPANLIQAQRDFFGAHTYALKSHPDQIVHTDWTGQGGNTTSTNYNI